MKAKEIKSAVKRLAKKNPEFAAWLIMQKALSGDAGACARVLDVIKKSHK